MSQTKSTPQYRGTGDSLALKILYIAYVALAYYISYSWMFPIVEAVVGSVPVLGLFIWLLSTISRVLHIGLIIVCIFVVFLPERPTEAPSCSHRGNIVFKTIYDWATAFLFVFVLMLPWLPVLILFAPFYMLYCASTETK